MFPKNVTVAVSASESDHQCSLGLCLFALLLLHLEQERPVDVREDTAEGDSGANQRIKLFVTADRELQVARCDTLDFQVLGRVTSEFEHFSGKVFENGGQVDGRFGTNARLLTRYIPQVALYTTAGELREDRSVSIQSRTEMRTRLYAATNFAPVPWRDDKNTKTPRSASRERKYVLGGPLSLSVISRPFVLGRLCRLFYHLSCLASVQVSVRRTWVTKKRRVPFPPGMFTRQKPGFTSRLFWATDEER